MANLCRADYGAFHSFQRAQLRQLRELPGKMLQIGRKWALWEQRNHGYQNRTGQLQASTEAFCYPHGDEFLLTLQMGMYYATYVDNLGYSRIREAKEYVVIDLTRLLSRYGTESPLD